MAHTPQAVEVTPGLFKPACSCGWAGKYGTYTVKQEVALRVASQHAAQKTEAEAAKGCGKQRFESKAEAEAVLFEAKVARGVLGNDRRQEQRVYCCPVCPGAFWHLTSKPAARRTA